MPSIEYTQSKGLIQKSSTTSEINLQGELFGARNKVETIADGSLATALKTLSLEDSGKTFLIAAQTNADNKVITLPQTEARKTSAKLTTAGAFTLGKTLSINAFGKSVTFLFVANDGAANADLVDSAGQADVNGQFVAVRISDGAANAITNLQAAIGDANAFGNTVATVDVGGDATSIEAAVAGNKNGTITSNDSQITINAQPTDGADAAANALGVNYTFITQAVTGKIVHIQLGTNNLETATSVLVKGTIPSAGGGGSTDNGNDTKVSLTGAAEAGTVIRCVYDDTSTGTWFFSGQQLTDAKVAFA